MIDTAGGMLPQSFDRLMWSPLAPFEVGDTSPQADFTAEVRAVADDGRPTSVAFHFAWSLDDPRYRFVAFTGSVRGGHEVYRAVSQRVLGIGLELGGKDAAYVLDDADLEARLFVPPSARPPTASTGASIAPGVLVEREAARLAAPSPRVGAGAARSPYRVVRPAATAVPAPSGRPCRPGPASRRRGSRSG